MADTRICEEKDTTFGLEMICYDRLQNIVCTFAKVTTVLQKAKQTSERATVSLARGTAAVGDELLELGFWFCRDS